MRTKEEIMEEFSVTWHRERDPAKLNRTEVKFWELMLALLADIRDDQVTHNNEMEARGVFK